MAGYTFIDDDFEVANDAANGAAQAYVVALGLYELIDRFRFRDPSAPVPAPGTDGAPDDVRQAAMAALHAAASARFLYEDLFTRAVPDDVVERDLPEVAGLGAIVALDDEQTVADCRSLNDVRVAAERAAGEAVRALRRVAQIGLGVAQYAYEDDDTELVERTCITLLVDSPAAVGHPALDDHSVRGRTRPEVAVELAGTVARFLVTAEEPATWLEIGADGRTLHTIRFAEGRGLHVEGLGTFQAPVVISEMVEALLDVCIDVDGVAPADLQVTWSVEDHGDGYEDDSPYFD